MSDGAFEIDGRSYSYEILEATGYDGEDWSDSEIEEHIHECDQVFYRVDAEWGNEETFFRWLGGPFESMGDIESAIEDDTDFYE